MQEKLKTALHEQKQGTFITVPRQTVEQFLKYWLEDVHKPGIRVHTYVRYEGMLRLHFMPVLGHLQLLKLSPQHIQALYAQKLKEGLSATSVNVLHAILHKAFDHAVRLNLLPRNICDVVSPLRAEEHEINAVSLEQVQQLLTAAKDHHLEALFVLALMTGMRRGELLALKWQDVNFAESTLYVSRAFIEVTGRGIIETEPKTAKGRRSNHLPPFAIEALKKRRAYQVEARRQAEIWQERDLIFCTSRGTPFIATYVHGVFKALLKKANLPDIGFHDLRHSAATLLLGMGTHPKVVQEILGHSQISMTMDIYSHVMPTMQKEAMTKLHEVLEQKP